MIEAEDPVFKALADTTRRRLLCALAQGSPKTATQLAREFPITRQGIAKHLALLARAGLVQTQIKGREKRYAFIPLSLRPASAWIEKTGKQADAKTTI